MKLKPEPMFWLGDNRGIYIPRDFAKCWDETARANRISGVSEEDWSILEAGPDHKDYWETWDDVLRDAKVIADNGLRYFVYQMGDVWLIPEGMEWSDDKEFFVWPEDAEVIEPEDQTQGDVLGLDDERPKP